jgi:hypothetical protein
MDRLQKSMNAYIKWISRRNDTYEDKEKGVPASYLGRTMVNHGEDFEPDSEFGNCLITMGRANERLAGLQEQYAADATALWLESLERSLAMMKDYQVRPIGGNPPMPAMTKALTEHPQAARKKLENRRLAYDASMAKLAKARRDDFRVEEEVRTNKAKYEETSEDVMRRMQDIKDAEVDSVRDLSSFLDTELDYHERCVEELRRAKQSWAAGDGGMAPPRRITGGGGGRSRSSTAQSFTGGRLSRTNSHSVYDDDDVIPEREPARLPIRPASRPSNGYRDSTPDIPATTRPTIGRANTFQGRVPSSGELGGRFNAGAARAGLRPVGRIQTTGNVFSDDGEDTASGSGSPDWADRSASPATSLGSLSRSTSNIAAQRKAPPPPPPSRSKKPPPPVPVKRDLGYER